MRKRRACARSRGSSRGGNEAGWCGTAGRRAARRGRAECLDRTEPCSPQRERAVFGPTQGNVPQQKVQQDTEVKNGQFSVVVLCGMASKPDDLDNSWTIKVEGGVVQVMQPNHYRGYYT